ncbi:hypothetical protein BWL13_02577 [Microbacterium oleivorans]|nr:hypothetical protein BWL13_02577 [Microbacterium oleivorans]
MLGHGSIMAAPADTRPAGSVRGMTAGDVASRVRRSGAGAVVAVITGAAAVLAWRSGRDLAWVPLVSTALVVAGYLAAVTLVDSAMR